jgi:hypothetical protein
MLLCRITYEDECRRKFSVWIDHIEREAFWGSGISDYTVALQRLQVRWKHHTSPKYLILEGSKPMKPYTALFATADIGVMTERHAVADLILCHLEAAQRADMGPRSFLVKMDRRIHKADQSLFVSG